MQPVQSRTQISRPIRLPQQPRLYPAVPASYGPRPLQGGIRPSGPRCPLSRDFGGFTLSSRHGGQVAWKAVPDPKPTFPSPLTCSDRVDREAIARRPRATDLYVALMSGGTGTARMLGAHGSGAWLQRHVGAAPPDVPHRVLHREVAFVVEVDRAQHGVELVLAAGMRSSPGAPASRLSRPPAPTPERQHKRTGCDPPVRNLTRGTARRRALLRRVRAGRDIEEERSFGRGAGNEAKILGRQAEPAIS